jgi:hypothetical protein
MNKLYVVAILSIVFMTGCATVGGLRPGTGSTFIINNRNYNEIWRASIRVVSRSLTIVESNKDDGVIKAVRRPSITNFGVVVGVFITEKVRDKKYEIEVLSKKRIQIEPSSDEEFIPFTGRNPEWTIIEGVKTELDL